LFSQAEIRREARTALLSARVPFLLFAGLTLLVTAALNLLDVSFSGATYAELFSSGPVGIFVFVLTSLISTLLEAGRVEYCGAALRGERAAYADLFCGFSFVFRFLLTVTLMGLLIGFGFSFFFVPGVLLFYRCRFVLYILCEDPSLSSVTILRRSHEELKGFKGELFLLDLSLLLPAMICAAPLLWWQLFSAEFTAGLPAPVLGLLGSVMSFPALLMSFYRTTVEMAFRRRILQYKYPDVTDPV
jgi:hypothetical protein